MTVLITSGGMSERIDGVRAITNTSTGKTGAVIADFFASHGEKILYLHHNSAVLPASKVNCFSYKSFSDLDTRIRELLRDEPVDVVIHLAAVSDYSVKHIKIGDKIYLPVDLEKIDSKEPVTIELKRNHKILERIPGYASGNRPGRNKKTPVIIGFKLTNSLDPETQQIAIRKIVNRGTADFIVHNDLHHISEKEHKTTIYNREMKQTGSAATKEELAALLYNLIKENT